jgi:hypothetical protein
MGNGLGSFEYRDASGTGISAIDKAVTGESDEK